MSEDSEITKDQPRSWLERLGDALLREPQDQVQLIELLRSAKEHDVLDSETFNMIERVLQVSDMQARDIMISRSQMVVIEHDAKLCDILPMVIESAHSRFPIIGDNRDEIIGILLAKDLLAFSSKGKDHEFEIQKIMRKAVFVPESKCLDVLLREFRLNRNHMAVVVDEYGGTAGLVTMEDVLEEIVGEIEDEYDIDEDIYIKKIDDNTYLVQSLTPIEVFNESFSENFTDEEFDTIGGLIMNQFGCLPKRGETIRFGKYQFKILIADKRRIQLLQVSL